MDYTESQSEYESAAAAATEDVEKSVFIGGNSSITNGTFAEVNSIGNVQRKRNHEVMMEGKQTANEMRGPEFGGKMPKRQSFVQTVMTWTKTLDDAFLKPAPKKNSPNVSVVGPESTGELSIPTGCGDPVEDANKGEVDQGKKPADKNWDQRLEELRAYKERTGHANPPQTKGLPKTEYALAGWLGGQRLRYRNGTLGKEKVEQLLALGCTGFDEPKAHTPQNISWDQRFEELKVYKERTGHANPRRMKGISEPDQRLANWLTNQRVQSRRGKLVIKKVQKLLALGCTGFDEPKPYTPNVSWDQNFEELKVYKEQTGHANIPRNTRKKGLPKEDRLATWLCYQRVKFRKGTMEQEKVGQLLALGCTGFEDPKAYTPSVLGQTS